MLQLFKKEKYSELQFSASSFYIDVIVNYHLPLSTFLTFSVASCAAVYPCNDMVVESTPWERSKRHAWTLPCWATRWRAVWPRLSNAFTCKKQHRSKRCRKHMMNTCKIQYTVQQLYLCSLLQKYIHDIIMRFVSSNMKRCQKVSVITENKWKIAYNANNRKIF